MKARSSSGFGVEHAIAFIDSLTLGESSQFDEEKDDQSFRSFDDVNSKYSILKCRKSSPIHLWRNWSIYRDGHVPQSFGSAKHKRQVFYRWSQLAQEIVDDREASVYKVLSCQLALILRETIENWLEWLEYRKIKELCRNLKVPSALNLSTARDLMENYRKKYRPRYSQLSFP